MARQTLVTFVDDLDGTEAEGTERFSLDGADYEIDLSGENADRLRAALAEFVGAARTVKQPRGARGAVRNGNGRGNVADRELTQQIRSWAKEQGMPVSDRGRISAEVREAYNAR